MLIRLSDSDVVCENIVKSAALRRVEQWEWSDRSEGKWESQSAHNGQKNSTASYFVGRVQRHCETRLQHNNGRYIVVSLINMEHIC